MICETDDPTFDHHQAGPQHADRLTRWASLIGVIQLGQNGMGSIQVGVVDLAEHIKVPVV